MATFFTDKSAKAEIATLTERIEGLEADNETAAKQIEALEEANRESEAKVAILSTEKETAEAKVETLTAELKTATESLATAQAEVEALPEKIEAGVLAKFESLGGQPVPASDKHDDGGSKEITREQFNAMDHSKRGEFIAQGGKIK